MADATNEMRFGSQRDVAAALDLSQPAVSKWVRRGVIKPGKDGKYDIAACVAAIEAARDPVAALNGVEGGATSKGQGSDGIEAKSTATGMPANLLRARTVSATLQAQKQQLELDRLKGELISKTDAEAAIRTAQTIVVERLEGLPGLLSARVMQAPSVAAGEEIIRAAIRSLRDELDKLGEGLSNAA